MAVGVVSLSGIDGLVGFAIFPSTYPSSPFDASSWMMFVFHCRRLSPLNFCSSDRSVSDGIPDIRIVLLSVILSIDLFLV